MRLGFRICVSTALFALIIPAGAQQEPATSSQPMSLADYARQQRGVKPTNNPSDAQEPAPGKSVADLARDMQGKELAKTRVSPEQAEQILKSVDKLMKFASEDSGLPIRSTVKRRMISRDDLVAMMNTRKMDDQEARRLQAEELTLKKFGYLPRVFSTSKFVDGMYAEGIAGFYDPRTKEISLLNWVPPEGQLDVMAHELTHALQDQNFNLLTWEHLSVSKKAAGSAFQVTSNDAAAEAEARRAVVEGQAMVVLVDHQLHQHGMEITLEQVPNVSEAIAQYEAMIVPDTPTIHAAPIFLREAATFPYREGLVFEIELLGKGGKQLAFNSVFERPPLNSHEVLHPQAYMTSEKIQVPQIPDISALVSEKYEIADSGGMGELDIRSLVKQLAGTRMAESIARAWRGGSYIALKRKAVPTEKATTADIALIYVSAWDSSETARRFAKFYAEALPRRYTNVSPVAGACQGADCPLENMQFNTEEGLVSIECRANNLVLVMESFDSNLAGALSSVTLKANSGANAHKSLAVAQPDLSLRYAASPIFADMRAMWQAEMLKQLTAFFATDRH